MKTPVCLALAGWCLAATTALAEVAQKTLDVLATANFDLVVAEGTPGGIAMAVRAAREGLSVLLVNHNAHLGGILSSGLGVWDSLWEGRRAPIYDEARQAIFDYYKTTYGEKSEQFLDALPGKSGHSNGKFEPHVAEKIFTDLVAKERNITLLPGFYAGDTTRSGSTLKAVTFHEFDGPRTVRITAQIFADCSYEGDLAAAAKVPYRVGREARGEYREPHAGVIFMQQVKEAPTPEIARAAELHARLNLRKFAGFQKIKLPESTGEADENVQAFNYRTPLSNVPENRVAAEKPAGYDPIALQRLEHGSIVAPLPNGKRGWNRPQLTDRQTAYVDGDWTARGRVLDAHWQATLGLLYYLQSDAGAGKLRGDWMGWGLAKDEFADNGFRPYEIYVREARRIVGRGVFTEHDGSLAPGLPRAPLHTDSIAATEWYFDSHACTSRHLAGCLEEGKMMLDVETFPGQVSYRTLLPQGIDNLLVPVCLSATHVAWGTIRLEPTWMALGESAAYAAAQAIQQKQTPAEINADQLVRTLAAKHVMVSFFNDVNVALDRPWVAGAEYFATKGFFHDYDARPDEPLKHATAVVWASAFGSVAAPGNFPNAIAQAVAKAEQTEGATITTKEFLALLPKAWEAIGTAANAPLTRGQALELLWGALK